MDPTPGDDWRLVGALVGELAELDAVERTARLDALADPDLRTAVTQMLAAFDTGGSLFDRPAAAWINPDGENSEHTDPREWIGERVGAWRLLALIGQGGMGAVYRAERDEGGFVQQAAIKMLRPDLVAGIASDRFRRERQVLARLTHRNIATLLDGGVTADGRPWFAMELVKGESITKWTASHRLDPVARLQVMRQVCGAVQHAHAALVVHRDLKPGNILVTADGTVKLLDFGIAKLLEPETDESRDGALTRWSGTPATPSYASPEQLDGAPMSTASDIYSLGVVLHELLSGQPPFVMGDDAAAHRRRVREEEPPALAASLRPDWARTFGEWSPSRVARWLHGDIARVVRLALRKEPDRRYPSADLFARDLDAVARGLPVVARRDSAGYRLRRLASRNPLATVITTVLAVAVVVTAGVAMDRARRAEIARRAANLETLRAERVVSFLSEVLSAPDPWTGDRDVTVREVLDDASERAARDFGDDPAVESRVRLALAQSYRGLGRLEQAEAELVRALTLGEPHDAFALHRALAEILGETGRHDEARKHYAEAEALARTTGDSLAIATVAADLAWLHGQRGFADSARGAALLAVGLRERHAAPPLDLANALNNLAVVELEAGRPDSAIVHLDSAVAILRRAGPSALAPLGTALGVLGGVMSDRGNFARAESLYRESLAIRRSVFGTSHPDEMATVVNLVVNALDQERTADALALSDTLLARLRSGTLPADHPLTAAVHTVRGRALLRSGDPREAVHELERALEMRRRLLPPGHPALAFVLTPLAEAYRTLGNVAASQRAAEEAHRILNDALGADHPRTVDAASHLR